jgi:uncharacterized cupredoxin-like copper-binding protein
MPAVTAPPTALADSTVPRRWASKRIVLGGAAAAVVLAAASTFAVAAGRGAFSGSPTCAVPSLSGTVVEVTAVDMGHMNGGGMMNGRRYAMPTMRLFTNAATVLAGGVSLLVRNAGSRTHELVVLPLADGALAGTRTVGAEGRIDESDSLGEVSRTCGAGAGDGIRAGSAGWVTLQLAPGRYELACNETNHYAQGMWTELVVT